MTMSRFNLRICASTILVIAGLLLAACGGTAAPVPTQPPAPTQAPVAGANATTESSAVAPEIEGTWLLTGTMQGSTIRSLVSYARGGALMVTDSGPGPAAGNVYQGTWTKTGPDEFAFTFLGFQYSANGNLTNYIRGRETLRLEPGGLAYNGVTTIEILDAVQKVIETLSGTTHATRVNAQ